MKYQYIIIPFTVTFQEFARFGFWWIYVRTFKQGVFKDDPSKPSDFMTALTVGWGFATTNAFISYISSLSHFTGPGFLPAPACQTVSIFYVMALIELVYGLMHLCWSLLAFEGYNSRTWWLPAFVYVSHLISSTLTYTLNNDSTGGCLVGSVSTTYIFALIVLGVTVWKFHGNNGLIECIKRD